MSLIDPNYELIDPCPDLHASFLQFNEEFFGGKLISCEVVWSKRMTKCAGLCHFQPRSRYCSIRLSEPLLKLRPRKDFVETLLHEMIHAFLFLTSQNMDRDGHGSNFQFHMYRINKKAGTSITIYHSFHAEVRLYQQHWWRCDGKCKELRPFYGWVKRSMNRAPSKNDRWWARHEEMCGGKFIKVKEPEPTAKTGNKRKSPEISTTSTLDKFFPGVGQKVGGKIEDEGKKPTKPRVKKTLNSPKKTPVKSPAVRFPGNGHRLGGDNSPDKKSRLITDFMPKIEQIEIPKTPENVAKKPQSSVLQSPPLIQLEHDDFGWDDEEVQILDFDDMVAIREQKQIESKAGSTVKNEIFLDSTNEPKPGPSKIKQEADIEIIQEKIHVRNEVEIISVKMANPNEELVECPGCIKRLPLREINEHLDFCVV